MAVSFVRFPYGTYTTTGTSTRPVISPVYYHYRLSTDTIKYGTNNTLSIRKVGYGSTTHNYACVIGGGQGRYYNSKDDTNLCYFTDDDYGFGVGGDHLAGEFIGIPVCADGASLGGKLSVGHSVESFAASSIAGYVSKDGVQSSAYVSVSMPYNGRSQSSLYMDVSSWRQNYTLFLAKTPSNYTLVGITADSGSQSGTDWLWDASTDITITFKLASSFTVAFDANGGSGGISNQGFVSGVSKTLTKNNNQITRANYKFMGWNTAADGSGTTYFDGADGSGILTAVGGAAGDTVTLYAQWEFFAFSITATKVNSDASGADVSSIGTLTLFDVTSQDVVAVEQNGSLYYVGKTDRQYRLYLDLADTKPDSLWRPTGVLVDGAYASEYLFYPSVGQEIKKDFLLTKRALCTFSAVISPDGVGGSATVVSPEEPDEDGKYAQGRKITVSVALPDGYENDVVRTASGYEYAVKAGKFTIKNLVSDDVATVYVKKSIFRTSVAKDAASEAALSSVSVDGGAFKDAEYGDSVSLAAVVAEGYEFAGWYDGSELLSSEATCSLAVTGVKSIVAKAKVSVKMGVHYTDAGDYLQSCAIQVNGAAYEQGAAIPVTLGESVSYALVLGSLESGGTELWKFNAWFDAPFTERVNPLALGASGTLMPTAAMNIVAEVTPQVITNVITVVMKEDENSADIPSDGAISVFPAADEGGWDAASGCYKLTFYGTKEVTLNAADSVTVGSDTLAFSKFEDGTTTSETVSYKLQTNGSRTVTAWYGKTGTRTVGVRYAIDGTGRGDRTKGSIAIVSSSDPDAVIDNENNTAVASRGYTVTIRASAMNGFRFAGWFKTENVGGTPYSEASELTLVVSTNLTLYAWFQKDTNAVFVWEGSEVNKSMEWRSKVYAASRPFNPSALRVDTNGYPVIEVDVDMFSSPDFSPTARAIVTNLASQQARRLPKRRPERYLQVTVKNDHEVDALFVGTSMGGLAV